MDRKKIFEIAKASFHEWQHNNATLRAAAIAFFIILPFPSLLLITVEIYSQFYGPAAGAQLLIQQISSIAGPTVAFLVGQLLEGTANPFTSFFNSLISIAFAVAGAVGAFAVLQDTLNVVWNVELPKTRSFMTKTKSRFFPFVLVLISAIVVVGWLQFSILVFDSMGDALANVIGTLAASAFLFLMQVFFSFGSAILLFAIILKEMPETEIEWSDVWLGAIIAAIVFTIFNNFFGFYLRTFPVTSVAGVAGSLMILLLWVFIIGLVLIYGAQFSKSVAETIGSHSGREPGHKHLAKPQLVDYLLENKAAKDTLSDQAKLEKWQPTEEETRIPKDETKKTENEGTNHRETTSTENNQKRQQPSEEEETKETNTEIAFSEAESSGSAEKEYKLEVKWKTKKESEKEEK